MEKGASNSKFVGHSTEIIWQSKVKGPLTLFDHSEQLNPIESWKKIPVFVNSSPTENKKQNPSSN